MIKGLDSRINFILLLSWISSVCIYTFAELSHLVFFKNLILLFSSLLFIGTFMNPYKIKVNTIILVFIFLKVTFLIFALVDTSFLLHIMNNGDATEYHIPMILSLNSENFLDYISDYEKYASETGKFTHVIYSFFYFFCSPFYELFNISNINGVMISSYILNTIFLVLISLYLYKVLKDEKIDNNYIVFSISLILFSPFILTWSSFVLKETLYVCIIILSMISIIKGNYKLLLFIGIFFFIDRMYMLYFIFFIFILSNRFNKNMILILILILVSMIYMIFPVEHYINMVMYMYDYNALKVEGGESLVQSNSMFTNIMRVLFTPFPFSAFKNDVVQLSVFYREHFIVSILYLYFMLKILLTKNNNFKYLLLLILLINIIIFPTAARQKITILIPFISIVYVLYLNSKKHNFNLNKYWII